MNKYFIFVFFLLFACSDNKNEFVKPSDLSNVYLVNLDKPVMVINGILHFDSKDSFFKTIKHVPTMTEADFIAWEKNLGFTSMRRVVNNAYLELDKAQTPDEYVSVTKKYSNVIEMKEGSVRNKVEDNTYRSISNEDGVYYVDGILYKVSGDYVFYSTNLKNLLSATQEIELDKNVGFFNYLTNLDIPQKNNATRIMGACSDIVDATHTESDRRVILNAYFSTFVHLGWRSLPSSCRYIFGNRVCIPGGPETYCMNETVTINIKVRGEKKSVFGWRSYVTSLEFANLTFNATVVKNTGGSNYETRNYGVTNLSKSSPADDDEYLYVIDTDLNRVCGEGQTAITYGFFNQFSVNYKSRGTPNWGIYSCN